MKKIIFISLFFLLNTSHGATWKKVAGGDAIQVCPDNYLFVPALAPYTTRDFCVMKYEAKKDTYGVAVSVAAGTPWVSVNRAGARAACQALGRSYELISNDQWQTMARNIAGTAVNWNSGVVGSGQLNRGHSDNSPTNSLAADSDDNVACSGTGQTCSSTLWDSQRRTHVLSNGGVIWDVAGNVWEWVTNDNNIVNGANGYISEMSAGDIRQNRYGANSATLCAAPGATPWCGMGHGLFNASAGAVVRGGYLDDDLKIGIFAADLSDATNASGIYYGFRCIFVP